MIDLVLAVPGKNTSAPVPCSGARVPQKRTDRLWSSGRLLIVSLSYALVLFSRAQLPNK